MFSCQFFPPPLRSLTCPLFVVPRPSISLALPLSMLPLPLFLHTKREQLQFIRESATRVQSPPFPKWPCNCVAQTPEWPLRLSFLKRCKQLKRPPQSTVIYIFCIIGLLFKYVNFVMNYFLRSQSSEENLRTRFLCINYTYVHIVISKPVVFAEI